MELMQHEVEAADIIVRQPHILLFDDMGIGKTISTLEGLKKASEGFVGVYKCIVCAPNTILCQWSDTILDMLGDSFKCVLALGSPADREVKYNYFNSIQSNVILLTSYSLIMKDNFFKSVKANVLVLDEGYLFRNKNTKLYWFLKDFVKRFEKSIILSGNTSSFTPQQFYDIVDLIFPGKIQKGTKQSMQRDLGECYISRDLTSILNIPSPLIFQSALSLSEDQKAFLTDLSLEENRLSKTDRYITNLFYRKKLDILNSPRIYDNSLSMSPKEEYLLSTVKILGAKCVVYCSDRKFYNLVKSDLNNAGINYVQVSGNIPIHKRERNLRLFNQDPKVMCLLLSGVGKFGLNLQVASNVICMGVPKSKFDLDQIIGRLYRINQKETVSCYIPYHIDSVEYKLVKSLQ